MPTVIGMGRHRLVGVVGIVAVPVAVLTMRSGAVVANDIATYDTAEPAWALELFFGYTYAVMILAPGTAGMLLAVSSLRAISQSRGRAAFVLVAAAVTALALPWLPIPVPAIPYHVLGV